MTTTWVLASPTNILEIDPRCFTFMVGIVFSNICCQLIVAQMSNTRCELFSWLLLPVGAIVAAALMLPSSLHLELPLLYGLTAFTFFAHVHYGVCLVSEKHLSETYWNIHSFIVLFFSFVTGTPNVQTSQYLVLPFEAAERLTFSRQCLLVSASI